MPPRTATTPRPAPDLLPDSLPGKDSPDVFSDDARRNNKPEMTPDSLPRADESLPLDSRRSQDESEIARAEQETWFEHPEGSAPALDRLTQDRKPKTEER